MVLKEGYSISAPDLSVAGDQAPRRRGPTCSSTRATTRTSRSSCARPRSRASALRAYIGHGAGHSQLDKLKEAFGAKEIEGFHTVDPIASQLLDPKKLKPGVGELTAEMVKRYKALYDKDVPDRAIAPHVSMGFNNMWILLNDVLPRAITKHGGFGPDALAKAARETDIPEGGTMQGYGVKFNPPGHRFAGQNERAFPAVFQIIEGKFELVYPEDRGDRPARSCRCRRPRRLRLADASGGGLDGPLRLPRGPRAPATGARPAPRSAPCHDADRSPGVTKRFGGFTALNEVSFEVREGEILGLIGPNGSGKTTLFNCISGALPPTAGSIRFRGDEIGGLTPDAICHRGIARTFQIPRPFRKLSILENVAVAAHYGADRARPPRPRRAGGRARCSSWSGCPPIPRRRRRCSAPAGSRSSSWPGRWPPGPSSSWPTRAWAGSTRPRWPSAAEMLKRVRGELGITIVWVEHIMATLMRVVDRIVVLDHGEKIAEGPPREVAEDPHGRSRRTSARRSCLRMSLLELELGHHARATATSRRCGT